MNENLEMDSIQMDYELSPSERKEIRERYPNVYFPDPVKEPLWFGRRDHTRISDRKVIFDQRAEVREGNPAVFGICSERYKIVPYEDIIHMVEKTVSGLTDYGKVLVCPHTYLDGARMCTTINFPDMKHLIKKVDAITPKIEVFTSYDLSTKLKGRFGAFQLTCSNGAGIWKSFKAFAKRHLQNLFLSDLGETISSGMSLFGEQVNQWKIWAEKRVSPELYEGIWDELPFSKAERVKIEGLKQIGSGLLLPKAIEAKDLDLWTLSSVLTQFATHEVKSELRRFDLEPAIARTMEMASNNLIKPKKVQAVSTIH